MANVMLFLEIGEAETLLSLAEKGIGVLAGGVGTESSRGDVAALATAGAIYCKLLREIEKTKEAAAETEQKQAESEKYFASLATDKTNERTNTD